MKEGISIKVDTVGLDEAIEKANRLVERLREASDIIGSIPGERDSQTRRVSLRYALDEANAGERGEILITQEMLEEFRALVRRADQWNI